MKYFLILAVVLLGCRPRVDDQSSAKTISNPDLQISRVVTLDQKEISGASWVDQSKSSLVTIADNGFRILALQRQSGDVKEADLFGEVERFYTNAKRGSQWEAVARDGGGNTFILQESPLRIFVFNNANTLRAVIHLSNKSDKDLRQQFDRTPNSGGEGFVLLRNGHILLLKEKEPVAIIEYAPIESNKVAQGFKPGMALEFGGEFAFRNGEQEFVPVKTWVIGKKASQMAGDLSELKVGNDGRLYAISAQDDILIALERCLKPTDSDERFKFEHVWKLPDPIQHPEALLIGPQNEIIIAIDKTKANRNLFVLNSIQTDPFAPCDF